MKLQIETARVLKVTLMTLTVIGFLFVLYMGILHEGPGGPATATEACAVHQGVRAQTKFDVVCIDKAEFYAVSSGLPVKTGWVRSR